MTEPDPRLVAALAEALHHYRGTCELWTISGAACPVDHRVDAAAILRNGAVFLPDGLTGEDLRRSDFFDEQAAALATLRAAPLDVRMVVQAINAVAKRHGVAKDPPERPLMHIFGYTSATPDMDAEIATEYAALAAAKETP